MLFHVIYTNTKTRIMTLFIKNKIIIMNKDQVLGLVRHILTFGGGILVAKGLASDAMSTELIGSLISVVGIVWSIVSKKK
jgi:hypothetical protein